MESKEGNQDLAGLDPDDVQAKVLQALQDHNFDEVESLARSDVECQRSLTKVLPFVISGLNTNITEITTNLKDMRNRTAQLKETTETLVSRASRVRDQAGASKCKRKEAASIQREAESSAAKMSLVEQDTDKYINTRKSLLEGILRYKASLMNLQRMIQ